VTRNLILCLDGTGNIWGNGHDTNVVKIVRRLVKDDEQLMYYDPGVGTTDNFPPIGFWNKVGAYARRVVGLALAGGIYASIGRGYEFVVDNFRPGDRVCLFGFSRGAFTARSIAGLIDQFGVVRPAAKGMIALLVRAYFSKPEKRAWYTGKTRSDLADDIKRNFCSPEGAAATIHLVGVWDTVASVGISGLEITTDANVRQKNYRHVRHAVALNEQRWKYEPRLYTDIGAPVCPGQTYKQVWFTGCHSDVGGSYPEDGLSNITLRWMIDEAADPLVGVRFDGEATGVGNPNGLAHDEAFQSPGWVLVGLCERDRPSGATMDPSVGMRQDGKSVWKPLLTRPRFWLYAFGSLILTAVPGLILGFSNLCYQVHPWHYLTTPPAFSTNVAWWVTLLDCALIPVYVLFLTLLIVHARQGLRYSPGNNTARVLDRWTAGLPICVLALSDLLEDLGVFHGLRWGGSTAAELIPWIQAFAAVKLVALGSLVVYLPVVAGLSYIQAKRDPSE
jgi:hypothetical protein